MATPRKVEKSIDLESVSPDRSTMLPSPHSHRIAPQNNAMT